MRYGYTMTGRPRPPAALVGPMGRPPSQALLDMLAPILREIIAEQFGHEDPYRDDCHDTEAIFEDCMAQYADMDQSTVAAVVLGNCPFWQFEEA